MVRNVKSLSKKSTYRELQDLLINMPRLKAFPVVDDPGNCFFFLIKYELLYNQK